MTIQTKQITTVLLLGSLLSTPEAFSAEKCSKNIVRSSVYFVPHIKDYCPSLTPCKEFKEEVEDKGSGTLYGNRILNYLGKEVDIGTCDTAIGKRGTCLKPFISVAADPDFYRMGDIIEVPAMKGLVFTLPNGKTLIHPGYFIVEDIGADIQGSNRFDFFTGGYNAKDPRNPFGYEGDEKTIMSDRFDCSRRKKFRTVRRGKSPDYNTSLAMIEKALQNLSNETILASKDAGKSVRGLQ